MSYTLYLGQLQKRVNSTKQPTYTTWASYDVVLKQAPVDYDNPTFLLDAEFASLAPLNYNYAVVWGRFYWIEDIRAVRTGQTEVTLSFDVLASNKASIMNTKAFIEYGFNTFDAGDSTSRIADNRRPVVKNPSVYTTQADVTGGALSATGCFIMQCVSELWGVACYAMTATELNALLNTLTGDLYTDIDTITNDLDPADIALNLKQLALLVGRGYKDSLLAESAIGAIKSIHWLPISRSSIPGTAGSNIYLGSYPTGTTGTRIAHNALWTNTGSISIPWPVNDWRRNNIQMSLYVPFFGTVPVQVDQCIGNGSVSFTLSLDVLGGDLSIRVTSGSQTIYTGSTNIAAPYAFGVSSITASGKLSGAIQSMGGVLEMATGAVDVGAGIIGSAFKNVSGGAANLLAGAQNVASGYAQTIQPLITSAGSMGGIAALGQSTNMILTLFYYPPITDSDFESIYGHPVYKVDKPVAGFCKTRGFSWESEEEAKYIAYVNAVMDGGCFIE